ncbi:hypothetical protein [Dickeya sp. DW 0440]|uniref:Uncharacterized protein n=1 Tax=Dickeya aquatica TaxID=1401087 RepID=A0A375AE67_9GAMM|nr:hypothetical protein [Dickeya sp. DW 0440]SLM63889.1 hypothetical protein DAQ1742_03058 [Dickeya aquatica]
MLEGDRHHQVDGVLVDMRYLPPECTDMTVFFVVPTGYQVYPSVIDKEPE